MVLSLERNRVQASRWNSQFHRLAVSCSVNGISLRADARILGHDSSLPDGGHDRELPAVDHHVTTLGVSGGIAEIVGGFLVKESLEQSAPDDKRIHAGIEIVVPEIVNEIKLIEIVADQGGLEYILECRLDGTLNVRSVLSSRRDPVSVSSPDAGDDHVRGIVVGVGTRRSREVSSGEGRCKIRDVVKTLLQGSQDVRKSSRIVGTAASRSYRPAWSEVDGVPGDIPGYWVIPDHRASEEIRDLKATANHVRRLIVSASRRRLDDGHGAASLHLGSIRVERVSQLGAAREEVAAGTVGAPAKVTALVKEDGHVNSLA
jgi:hypothetical protein